MKLDDINCYEAFSLRNDDYFCVAWKPKAHPICNMAFCGGGCKNGPAEFNPVCVCFSGVVFLESEMLCCVAFLVSAAVFASSVRLVWAFIYF